MAKEADRYYVTEPWRIVEKGFNPDYSLVSESIFSLGNEYMGVRGFFEEGYGGAHLTGSYFNGIYESRVKKKSGYKGIVNETQFMVNAVNWLDTKIIAGDEVLDLASAEISDFERVLDMRSGLLTRRFIWQLKNGVQLLLNFERILSMQDVSLGAQRITVTALTGETSLRVELGLDGTIIHQSEKKNFWAEVSGADDCAAEADNTDNADHADISLELQTVSTQQKTYSHMHVRQKMQPGTQGRQSIGSVKADRYRGLCLTADLAEKDTLTLERTVCHAVYRSSEDAEAYTAAKASAAKKAAETDFTSLAATNEKWWQRVWDSCDITIEGDEANQQGIRFCIFQLFQTYHGAVRGSNIGAKGLTGEAYNGNAFWDTETYCLPFFLFNDMEGVRNLLYFRYKTLPEARERAAQLDCRGAFYPIATISGTECCDLWQHASLQLQASTAVAYGIWFYEKMTGDEDFLLDYGLEMLIEIARMLASRGDWSGDGEHYGFYGVMGPDEFQMMVNNDFYTNWLGRFALDYAAKMTARVRAGAPEKFAALAERIGYAADEEILWQSMADHMYLSYDAERLLYEQQDGFFTLPHIDVDAIPVEDFPLYAHWSYDHIYRNDMIKQPDVLMVMLMFNSAFSTEQLEANYAYYEPRCIHESSLSPSVHSILASQLGRGDEAYDFFGFATRMDLDNYNRNTGEGIHTTSIAAAWMNIVYGFGGLRSDGERLSLSPSIPKQWSGYSFRIHAGSEVLSVQVDRKAVTLRVLGGTKNSTVHIRLFGEDVSVGQEAVVKALPGEQI